MEIQDRILLSNNDEDLKILTAVSTIVQSEEKDSLASLKIKMLDMMRKANGRGLAAPQVGLNKRIFVMRTQKGEDLFMVNPEIIKKSSIKIRFLEGCLSVPNVDSNKNRSRQITVVYLDEHGETHTKRMGNVDAVCVQHEIDHLDGKLI